MPRSQTEVRPAILSLFPPGDAELYAWDDATSFVSAHAEAIAMAARLKGTDAIDELRTERRPQPAIAKRPDWERAFGITKTRTALYGSTAQRQQQLVARFREGG